VKAFLEGKDSIAFVALTLLRDGLPSESKQRKIALAATIRAYVFEGSGRARALLYRVVRLNRVKY
jgi:hypothetical protein